MKKSKELKAVEALAWCEPFQTDTPRGKRWLRRAFVNPEFIKVFQNHNETMVRAGFALTRDSRTALWFSMKRDSFAEPIFQKKRKSPLTQHKEQPWEPPNADKIRADGIQESFDKLQEQFEELYKLYTQVKEENERLKGG